MKQNLFRLALAVVATLGLANQAHASGYEKTIMWGAHEGGLAGVATPYVQGSEAIYFNPAGLIAEKRGNDIAFNISPLFTKFHGPLNNNNDDVTSQAGYSTPLGLTYSYAPNADWAFGAGYYVSGGANAEYPAVVFPDFTANTVDYKTNLAVTELSLGAAYRVNENLKIGAAWRYSMVSADFVTVQRQDTPSPFGSLLVNPNITGLRDTDQTGFRLGAQYKVNDKLNLGIMFRSQVNFEATGQVSGKVVYNGSGGGTQTIIPKDMTASTLLPAQINFGGTYDLSDAWRLFGEYGWTQYSKVGDVALNGVISTAQLGTLSKSGVVPQGWSDEHDFKIAAEYHSMPWPLRFGFAWVTRVTSNDFARGTFVPPGPAQLYTIGTGKTITVAENPMTFDGALEYTTVSGDDTTGAAAGVGGTGKDIRNGTYGVTAYAVHLGAKYTF